MRWEGSGGVKPADTGKERRGRTQDVTGRWVPLAMGGRGGYPREQQVWAELPRWEREWRGKAEQHQSGPAKGSRDKDHTVSKWHEWQILLSGQTWGRKEAACVWAWGGTKRTWKQGLDRIKCGVTEP